MQFDNRRARVALLCLSLIAASYLLYMGTAFLWVLPGGTPYTFGERLMPTLLISIALILDFNATYLLRQGSQRPFPLLLLFNLAVTVLGAILLSIVIWRGHWFEMIRSS